MRIRTQAGYSATFAWVLLLRLAVNLTWSQTNPVPSPSDPNATAKESKPQETSLSSQQLQEQHAQLLRALDLIRRDAAINFQTYASGMERIRRETELNQQRFADAMDVKVDLLNRSFASERERELEALRRSNRFALTGASLLVAILLLEILFVAWVSMRALNRLAARLSAGFSGQTLSPDPGGVLEMPTGQWLTGNLIHETNLRLQNALERLEKRLSCLEDTANRVPNVNHPPQLQGSNPPHPPSGSKTLTSRRGKGSGVSLTLGEGKSLIFLPHEKGLTQFHTCGNFLRRLWKRIQPARIARSP